MCELLALSTSQPARLTFSLHTLAAHGGEAGNIHDGWGVAFYQGEDVALFREPVAAAGSPLVRYLETQGPSTSLAISHIRHATRGTVQFANTQPFMRELGGRMHVFAHNGDLPGIEGSAVLATGPYRPIGQTDSERAFCALLARMRTLWEEAELSSLEARMSLLASFAVDLRTLGPANFLYADGDALFAHGHRRRQRAGGRAEPPGLWVLQRHCAPTDPSPDHRAGVSIDHAEQVALLVASVPLTDEAWRPLSEGELVAVRAGDVLATRFPAAA
jgi:glutamine amidotransferase